MGAKLREERRAARTTDEIEYPLDYRSRGRRVARISDERSELDPKPRSLSARGRFIILSPVPSPPFTRRDRNMRICLSLAVLAFAGPAIAAEKSAVAVEQMKKDIYFLAGEECQGRGVETEGLKIAGEYIAKSFKDAGLKPAGKGGTYFQPFGIDGPTRLGTPNTLSLTGPDGKVLDLKYGEQFTPTAMSAKGTTGAGLVFVGYGISAEKLKYDEYAGLDVKGKFVIVLRRTPRADDKEKPFDKDPASAHAALVTKLALAAQKKAAGVILVNDAVYGKDNDPLLDFNYRGAPPVEFPVLHIKRDVLAQLLAAEDKKLADLEKAMDELKPQPVVIKGWKAEAVVTVSKVSFPVRNVVGVVEGSGPLADETVVVGAHYDHLGSGEPGSMLGPQGKGKVHYGADDNGSGTTGLLELARRFGAMKGRIGRRIVFIAFTGEERGLFGSIHYCKEPSFPLDKTAFMLNMDMIGRVTPVPRESEFAKVVGLAALAGPTGPVIPALRDRVVVYGTGTAEGMDDLVTNSNRKFDFQMIKVPGGTGPSDHDSFYKKKIPVLFFFTGTHKDYHRPTDTPEKINLEGMKKVVDLGETFLNHFASTTEKPKYLVTKGGWEDPTEDRPRVSRPAMPKLGIMPGNYEDKEGGVLVEGLSPGGAAEKAGLKDKDIIIEIAGKPVKNIDGYMAAMAGQKAGVAIDVIVLRNDKKMTIKVTPNP